MPSEAPAPLAALGRSKAFWKWLGGLALSALTLGAPFAWTWGNSRASEGYVQTAIGANDESVRLDKNRLQQLELTVVDLASQLGTNRVELANHRQWLYREIWLRVGYQAADAERDPRKRAIAAREARQQFEHLAASQDYESAANMALETPPPRR